MKLYHVSPAKNRANILSFRLDPIFSLGKQQVIWLVDETKLLWAIVHCSARHHTSADKLDIWLCPEVIHKLQKTPWKGVYKTPCAVRPVDWETVTNYVKVPRDGTQPEL